MLDMSCLQRLRTSGPFLTILWVRWSLERDPSCWASLPSSSRPLAPLAQHLSSQLLSWIMATSISHIPQLIQGWGGFCLFCDVSLAFHVLTSVPLRSRLLAMVFPPASLHATHGEPLCPSPTVKSWVSGLATMSVCSQVCRSFQCPSVCPQIQISPHQGLYIEHLCRHKRPQHNARSCCQEGQGIFVASDAPQCRRLRKEKKRT